MTFPDTTACLPEHVADARPVHREEEHVRLRRGIARRTGACVPAGVACQPLELLVVVRIAENDVVAGAGKDGPELAAHQS
jgi:hypothetical protein